MPNMSTIRIKGFQSHTDSTINLSDRLNVVTGPSGQGKTAIIRAVRWVAFGEPSGEAFVNESVGEAEVTITLDDGVSVTKTRRKGKTSYKLSTIDEPFDKAEVPEEVKQALGLNKQTFGDFEATLNFAYQLDAPFLLSESASTGAKILGKLAGTEAVDGAIKDVSKDTHAARQTKSSAEKEMQRIDGQLLEYHDIEQVGKQIESCQRLLDQASQAHEKQKNLSHLSLVLSQASEQVFEIENKLDALLILPTITQDLENIEKAQQRYDALLSLYGQYSEASDRVDQMTRELERYTELEAIGKHLELATVDSSRYESLTSLSTAYTSYTQEVKRIAEGLEGIGDLYYLQDMLATVDLRHTLFEQLHSLDTLYGHHNDAASVLDSQLQKLQHVDASVQMVPEIEERYQRLMVLLSLDSQLSLDKQKINSLDLSIATENIRIEEYANQLAAEWESVGGICPLCENPVKGGHVHA